MRLALLSKRHAKKPPPLIPLARKPLNYFGTSEFAKLLGISRQRLNQLKSDSAFPEPYEKLKMGSIWTLEQVSAYLQVRKTRGN